MTGVRALPVLGTLSCVNDGSEPSLCWDTRLCGSVTVLTQEVQGGK